jgi:Tfp pilus assembly protein PilF
MRRMSPVSLSVFAILFALCFVENSLGQQNRSSISGFIFGADRRPVSQVVVELRGEFSTVGRVRTDGSGRYYFGSLAHGRYTVRVMPMGTPFLEANEDVEIAGTGMRGQPVTDNVQKDIYLKPRRGADSIPFQAEVVFAQEVPKDAEAHYKRAVEDLNSQRTQTAIESLEKAVAAFPDYFMALKRLGLVRLTQERYEDAEKIFDRAVRINERCFDCWYGLGYAAYTTKGFDRSVIAAGKAAELKPDSVEANLLLGMASRMTKDYAKSEASLQRASKIADGSSPDVHWHLALLYGKDMNKFAEAAKELEAYLKAAPEAPNKEDIKKLIRQFKDKARDQS